VRILLIAAVATALSPLTYGAEVPQSYGDARANWDKHKASSDYQTYMSEFIQFNNHFHLDTRGGCYALGSEQVELMLVISRPSDSDFAVIENVLVDADSAKARCFIQSYRGLKTKVPPYAPFVLQMTMR
jgi:hypothetical protein